MKSLFELNFSPFWTGGFGIVNLPSRFTRKHVSVETEPQIEAVVIDFLWGLPTGFCKTLESICQFPCVFYPLSLPLPLPHLHSFKIIQAYLLFIKRLLDWLIKQRNSDLLLLEYPRFCLSWGLPPSVSGKPTPRLGQVLQPLIKLECCIQYALPPAPQPLQTLFSPSSFLLSLSPASHASQFLCRLTPTI